MNSRRCGVQALAFALILLIAPQRSSLAATEPELPNPGSVGGIDKQQQIQVGLQAMAEVYQQMPVLPDSNPVSEYVQGLGKKLAQVIPQEYSWPYQFHVIPQKEINAFALPGGPIFINVGTITAADNEAELVGVMAHEMSHVYMQHSAKQMAKGALAQGIAGVLGGILGSSGGTLGTLAQLGVNIGAGVVMLKYSRGDEAQADAVGAVIMYKAGYDPHAMADFFEKLAQQGGSGGPEFLKSHPNPGNRRAAIAKEIQEWPPKNYQTSSPAFAGIKQQASGGIKAYTAEEIANGAKQGIWARQNKESGATPPNLPAVGGGGAAGADVSNVTFEQVKPSGNLKQLDHSAFSLAYPDNWQAFGDQNSSVTIAPPAGVSQSGIAYGVVIDLMQNTNTSLDQATQEVIQTIQQGNAGTKISGSVKRMQVNGREARSVELTGTSPVMQNGKPLAERDWLVTVARPQGGALSVVFVAPDNTFPKLKPTYQKMLRSLQLK